MAILSSSPDASCGFTLVELVTVLLLLSISLTALLPAGRKQLDRMAVLGAREEVTGLLHRARFEAVAHGGAVLTLKAAPGTVTLSAAGEVVSRVALADEYRVEFTLSRNRSEAEITFDPLGLGRVASQTLGFFRGGAEAHLVVSSYGRVVRR